MKNMLYYMKISCIVGLLLLKGDGGGNVLEMSALQVANNYNHSTNSVGYILLASN